MALEEYRRKRDPARTPEPKAEKRPSPTGRLFVVQKHDATQLHYDLRLELDGVLLSWAVPKGPSLDPSEKRLAVHVEDHPVEYGSFEGVIPDEEYGGGTVLIWDRGEWEPWSDPHADLAKGTLKFNLSGTKLRGGWTLVRIKEKGQPTKNWLLIKERDDRAKSEDAFCVTDEEPFSVLSGRTIGEITAAREAVWGKDRQTLPKAADEVPWRRGVYPQGELETADLAAAKKTNPPKKLTLPAPEEATEAPDGDEWLHEIEPQGLRLICRLDERSVRIESADGNDHTRALPEIARAVSRLPVAKAILDGSLAFPGPAAGDGAAVFKAVEHGETGSFEYHVLDLIYAEGLDLRACPLTQRKDLLRSILEGASRPLAYADHVTGHGRTVLAEARKLGVPAIVSRAASSAYPPRTGEWLRVAISENNSAPSSRHRRAAAASATPVEICGVNLTHPDRVLYPEERVTKRMLAEYYEAIAERMLPHVARRPLSIVRCPQGVEKESFFQKQLGSMPAQHLRDGAADDNPYIALSDVKGLIMLAQWSSLEIHAWGCREDELEKPDRMIFDLDPGPGVPWEQIVEGAKGLRFLLEESGLVSFVKTSGGKGLHVYVPLTRRADWDDVKDFAAKVARHIVSCAPKHFTVLMSKPERKGKVFIDYLRNQRGSTCVAAYSTRARPGAQVSMPLAWDELDGPQPRFHIFKALERARSHEDPWSGLLTAKQQLTQAALRALAARGASETRRE